jgi:hypothetical protein
MTCIGRMIQPTRSKGVKRLRYDGVQATQTFATGTEVIQAALAKVAGVGKGAVQLSRPVDLQATVGEEHSRNPLVCEHCRSEMGGWRLWHPTYGVIYDEGEAIKRGRDESTAQRAGP